MAMGISMSGMTAGALLVVPAIAWAIDPEYDRLGWQTTALVIAGVIFVGAFIFPLILRNRPQDMGLNTDGDPAEPDPPAQREPTTEELAASQTAEPELTVGQALRTQAFWCIAFGHGFASMIILAVMTHLGIMMTELGYSLQTVAWIVSLYNIVSLPFQFGGGWLGDRIPTNVALFMFSMIQGIAVVLIAINTSLWMFYVFAILFGIGVWGADAPHHGDSGRVFRPGVLRQDSGHFDRAHEHTPAPCPDNDRVHARPVGRLPVGHRNARHPERRRSHTVPDRPQAEDRRAAASAGSRGCQRNGGRLPRMVNCLSRTIRLCR